MPVGFKKKKKGEDSFDIVMITIKHLQINQISVLNKPRGVDILLNNPTKNNSIYKCISIEIRQIADFLVDF